MEALSSRCVTNSRNLHEQAMALLSVREYTDAISLFTQAYELNDSGNEYGHLYRLAHTHALNGDIRLAKLLFRQCVGKIKSSRLWQDAIKLVWPHLSDEETLTYARMVFEDGYPSEDFSYYPGIIDGLIELKKQAAQNYSKEINQLNFIYKPSGYEKLIVAFTSRGYGNWQHTNLLRNSRADLLFLRDVQDAWYNKGLKYITEDIPSTVYFIRNFSDKYSQVLTLGGSSGGYASLLFGSLIKANLILAFSPQIRIPREDSPVDLGLLAGINPEYFDVRPFLAKDSRIRIWYDREYVYDHNQVVLLSLSDFPQIEINSLSCGGIHNVIPILVKNGVYHMLINDFTQNG